MQGFKSELQKAQDMGQVRLVITAKLNALGAMCAPNVTTKHINEAHPLPIQRCTILDFIHLPAAGQREQGAGEAAVLPGQDAHRSQVGVGHSSLSCTAGACRHGRLWCCCSLSAGASCKVTP